MRESEGENGNEHLIENSCTLLYDYIEWTRTLVVFLDCGCNFVVHSCFSPESWLVQVCVSVKQNQSKPQRCCKTKPKTYAAALHQNMVS